MLLCCLLLLQGHINLMLLCCLLLLQGHKADYCLPTSCHSLLQGHKADLRAMYEEWPFFAATIDLIEMILAKVRAPGQGWTRAEHNLRFPV